MPFKNDPKTAICRAGSYEESRDAIEKALDLLGGASKFIKKGMRVALKANLVMAKKIDAAATTHPDFVSAVCDIVTELGASALILDSPGNLYKPEVLKAAYRAAGYLPLAEKDGVGLNYDTSSAEVENPDASYLKRLEILKPLADADFIIDLPKLKTHCQMLYTGAVKNMFGSIPGLAKMEYHFRMPDYSHFADALIDIFLASKPGLAIMDGIKGMDGDGPTSGRVRDFGFVLASENAFSLDYYASMLMGIDYHRIPVLLNAEKRGIIDYSECSWKGLDPKACVIKDVKLPSSINLHFVGGIFKKIADSLIRPNVSFSERCKGCGYCARICPAKAITITDKRPSADNSKCIRCFCCHELCPHAAVSIKKNFLMNILSPVKDR